MKQRHAPKFPPVLILTFGILGISSGSILVRLAQGEAMPSLSIAAWRLIFAALILLPLAAKLRRQELREMAGKQWLLALVSGFMLSLHFATWITSLAYTSVASSTVLVTTAPLWVGLAAPFVLNEKLTNTLKIGIALAITGSVLIGLADIMKFSDGTLHFSLTEFTDQPNPFLGNILALFGAISASAYLIIGRQLRQQMSLLSYTAVVYSSAAGFLLIYALASGNALFGYSPTAYIFLLLMALFPQLIGHSSYNWALGYMGAATVAVVVIAEPIGASFLAMIFFQEIPNGITILGSAILLGGIVYASWPDKK